MKFDIFRRRRKAMETKDELLYRRYVVSIEMVNGLAGGTPLNQGMIAEHVKLFSQGVSNPLKYAKEVEGEVTEEAIEAYLKRCSSGFPADEGGAYIRGFQFNAMLKDAAQRMKLTMQKKGMGNTIRDGGLVFPHKLYLNSESLAVVERPVKPDNGPANIKIFQVAENVKMDVPCAVLENGDLTDKNFRQMWIVAQSIGLGANRHLGYGQFIVKDIVTEPVWNVEDLLTGSWLGKETVPVKAEVRAKK